MIYCKFTHSQTRLRNIKLVLFLLLFISLFSAIGTARKSRQTHIVKKGDSIAKIADFYSVSQRDLREMNGLRKNRPLKPGQKLQIPNVFRVSGKTYKVKKGDSLASIAAKFKRTTKEIAIANKISRTKPLKKGRTLIIPDKNNSPSTINTKNHKLKPILFLRVRMGDRARLKLYYQSGKLNKNSVQKLSYLARDKHGDKVKRLNTRLVKMIQLVSEQFPGKAIEIISGYRAQAGGNESQHAFGRALDFRISGVLPKTIWKYCKTLPRSGCGYYPNSGFVHMDAREKKVSWIDTSP